MTTKVFAHVLLFLLATSAVVASERKAEYFVQERGLPWPMAVEIETHQKLTAGIEKLLCKKYERSKFISLLERLEKDQLELLPVVARLNCRQSYSLLHLSLEYPAATFSAFRSLLKWVEVEGGQNGLAVLGQLMHCETDVVGHGRLNYTQHLKVRLLEYSGRDKQVLLENVDLLSAKLPAQSEMPYNSDLCALQESP